MVHTQEQLDELIAGLRQIQYVSIETIQEKDSQHNSTQQRTEAAATDFIEPLALNPKGRPRTKRITNAREGGRPSGGGHKKRHRSYRKEMRDLSTDRTYEGGHAPMVEGVSSVMTSRNLWACYSPT